MAKERTEIPRDIAARVLFESDRTCCVCRQRGRPVQIHHIDEDPSNSASENLCILCFDCHRDTQIRGGFDRKLDAAQIVLYKEEWLDKIGRRDRSGRADEIVQNGVEGTRIVKFIQASEKNENYSYSLDADYPQIDVGDQTATTSINLCINAFVARLLDRFRAEAIANSTSKNKMKQAAPTAPAWDDLSISHTISLFTSDLLSIEFSIGSYYAMAAHPNTITRTLNFIVHPPMQLELQDIFIPQSNYLDVLSRYCVPELHREQSSRFHDSKQRAEELRNKQDHWILAGAGPKHSNYERFVLLKHGMRVFFDAYQVGSYAEGRYDVFVPAHVLKPVLCELIAPFLI